MDNILSLLPRGYSHTEKLLSNISKSTFFLSPETGVAQQEADQEHRTLHALKSLVEISTDLHGSSSRRHCYDMERNCAAK